MRPEEAGSPTTGPGPGTGRSSLLRHRRRESARPAPAAGQLIERGGYVGDRLVAAVERRTQDSHNPDGVLITAGHGLRGVKVKTLTAHRHDPRFNVPVATKLLPTDPVSYTHLRAHETDS